MKRTTGLVSQVLREAGLFIVVEAAVQGAFIVYFSILAARFSVEEVGWYALMRRVLAIAAPILTLGLMESLAKYLAIYTGPAQRRHLMLVTAGVLAVTCALITGAAVLAPSAFAIAVFGSGRWVEFVFPFASFAVGIVAHMYVYAYLRGTFRISLLSAFQFLNLAAIPIAIVLVASAISFAVVITATGLSLLLCSAVFLPIARWISNGPAKDSSPTTAGPLPTWDFLRFGVTRVPALLLAAGLTSLVPVIAQFNLSSEQVGFLSIAVTLLIGVAGLVAPLGTVLLPHISAVWARDEQHRVSGRAHLLIGAAIQLFIFMTAHLILFSDIIIGLWMGPAYVESTAIARVVLLGAVGLGFYTATRAVLDAVSDSPVNTVNGAAAVSVVAVLAMLVPRAPSWMDSALLYAGCLAAGCSVLGLATYLALRRRFPHGASSDLRHLAWAVVGSVLTAALAQGLRPFASQGLAGFVAVEGSVALLYLLILWFARFEWLRVIAQRLWPGRFV